MLFLKVMMMDSRRRILLAALFQIFKCIDSTNIDTDECLVNNGGCQHICNNTNGSYTCSCEDGFLLETDLHNCTKSRCGKDLEGTYGGFLSPQFPFNYPPNTKCIWKITVPAEQTILLNFSSFNVEESDVGCAYDRVEVFSIIGRSVLKHGTFCGSRSPFLITSYENSMMIKFTSDRRVQNFGFAAFFYADKDECSDNNGGCQHFCNNTIGSYTCSCEDGFVLETDLHNCTEGCNYNITSPYGVIRSPFYPAYYPNRSDCSWLFTAKPGHRIKLDFKDFKLEPHQECEYDFIEAFNGDSNESPTLGKFCGSNVSNPILASGNRMYLVFKSNPSVEREGFKAIHKTVCGGRLFALREKQYIFSHAQYGAEDYSINTDCDWIIQAAENQRIKFHFLTFELEIGQECESDYVEVYDGEDDCTKSLGKFCGNEVPPEIYSSGEFLMVRFRSDDLITREGFSATYESVPFIDHVIVLETD